MLDKTIFNYTDLDIISIADLEKDIHPEASLIDYYKLFFQSCFGQGHFVVDKSNARIYLEDELSVMTYNYYPLIQDISNGKGLYRVSLGTIRSGLIPVNDFFSLFINCLNGHVNWRIWSAIWTYIFHLLSSNGSYFSDMSNLDVCNEHLRLYTIPNHSNSFRLTYRPHYRVMKLKNEIIMKFINLKEI